MNSEEIFYYKNLSKLVNTSKEKLTFFDQNQKAFFLDTNLDSWFNMMIAYAKVEKLTEQRVSQIEDLKWKQMPEELKLFAFDYCILNGTIFEK